MTKAYLAAAGLFIAANLCAQTNWMPDAGNPVATLAEGSNPYGPVVVMVGSEYHMYYTRKTATSETMDHMTSDDGKAWTLADTTLLAASGANDRFDKSKVGQPSIVVDGDTLRMWFWGAGAGVGSIGYAWSVDGKAWTKVDGPKSNKSVYDVAADGGSAVAIATPNVIKDGSGYKMWYARLTTSAGIQYSIGHATSPDGMAWTHVAGEAAGGAVLAAGEAGKFDSTGVFFPYVIKEGSTYRMWYSSQGEAGGIGYATSADGIAWTRVEGPEAKGAVLAGLTCSVLAKDGVYSMWYMGEAGVDHAISGATVGLPRARHWPGLRTPAPGRDALGKRLPQERPVRPVRLGFPSR